MPARPRLLRFAASRRYYVLLIHGIRDVQELSEIHEMVSKAETEILRRLQGRCLPFRFPEIGRFRINSRSDR